MLFVARSVFAVYRLSYLWYTAVGAATAVAVGLLVSFLTGPNDPLSVDPDLLAPAARRLLGLPNGEGREGRKSSKDPQDRDDTQARNQGGAKVRRQHASRQLCEAAVAAPGSSHLPVGSCRTAAPAKRRTCRPVPCRLARLARLALMAAAAATDRTARRSSQSHPAPACGQRAQLGSALSRWHRLASLSSAIRPTIIRTKDHFKHLRKRKIKTTKTN